MGMKLSISQPYVTFGQSGSMQPRGGGADALISNGSTLAIWDETDTLFQHGSAVQRASSSIPRPN